MALFKKVHFNAKIGKYRLKEKGCLLTKKLSTTVFPKRNPFGTRPPRSSIGIPSEDHSGNSPGAKLEKYGFYETENRE